MRRYKYIADIIQRISLERPETLRSSSTVKLSEVLAFSTMEEFVSWAAERKVDELGYAGFDATLDYLKELGLELQVESAAYRRVREAVEVRNIIVHNRGIVNSLFVRRTGNKDYALGTPFPLNPEYAGKAFTSLSDFAGGIDSACIRHFGLTAEFTTKRGGTT